MFWCSGKLVAALLLELLWMWFTLKVGWDPNSSSWTGLSAALELSDNDRGPDKLKSVWLVEYRGTNKAEVWVELWVWLAWFWEDINPKCWSRSVVDVSGNTATNKISSIVIDLQTYYINFKTNHLKSIFKQKCLCFWFLVIPTVQLEMSDVYCQLLLPCR